MYLAPLPFYRQGYWRVPLAPGCWVSGRNAAGHRRDAQRASGHAGRRDRDKGDAHHTMTGDRDPSQRPFTRATVTSPPLLQCPATFSGIYDCQPSSWIMCTFTLMYFLSGGETASAIPRWNLFLQSDSRVCRGRGRACFDFLASKQRDALQVGPMNIHEMLDRALPAPKPCHESSVTGWGETFPNPLSFDSDEML